ncbi:MAG: hypothetical protein ACE5JD_00305 [Candidatus Methylomirabilia bacterium]
MEQGFERVISEIGELRKAIAESQREVEGRIDKSFKWLVAIVVTSVTVTWFGVVTSLIF